MCIITMQRNKASFRSRDQLLCKFIGTKESVYIRKEFNSHKTGLEHQHGRLFIVFIVFFYYYYYCLRYVIRKRSIQNKLSYNTTQYNTIQHSKIQCNTIHYRTMPCHTLE